MCIEELYACEFTNSEYVEYGQVIEHIVIFMIECIKLIFLGFYIHNGNNQNNLLKCTKFDIGKSNVTHLTLLVSAFIVKF